MDAIDFDRFLPTQNFVLDVTQGGVETGWKITLGGPEHPKAVEFADKQLNRSIEQSRKARLALVSGSDLPDDQSSPESVRRENIAWIVARIVDWTPIKVDGKVYEFSDDAAFDLLTRPLFGGVLRQITRALETEKRFFALSA